MNIRRLFIFISLAFSCLAQAQPISLETLKRIGLPVVVVETIDAEEPTCDYLSIEDGFPGNTIRNATKVPGRVYVIEGNDTIYNSGEYEEGISGMTIKIRGNSSAFTDKKPYKIKLQKKADMLGVGEKYNDKNWLLLKEEFPSLNLMVGLKVNELVGMSWTPRFRYVNLLFNGDYRGLYMLCESVERNTECRLNVSKTGFIIEYDPYWWNEDLWFKSSRSERKYTFKYPDPEDVTEKQLQYITDFMTQVEASCYHHTYDQYIDVESFASWTLGHDILGTYDWYGSNIFMTKNDTLDSKLMMANMWDFDTIEMTSDAFATVHSFDGGFFTYTLFNSPYKTFTEAYLKRWDELNPMVFDEMEKFLNDFAASDEAQALEASRKLDFRLWEIYGPTVAENIESNIQWFRTRQKWLEQTIGDEILSDIHPLSIEAKPNQQKYYHLNGRRVSKDAKGFVITNGYKFFRK